MNPSQGDTDVLIVGAGPTGLSAALALTKLGVRVRIIDKNSARSEQSKALGVQAGTLECLDAALGPELAQQMLAAGRPARAAWIHLAQAEPIKISFATIPSVYNFILILAQSETERILEETLNSCGVSVERNTEFVSAEQSASSVSSKIKSGSAELVDIKSAFVVGGDGAHSAVRKQLEIPFLGAAYTGDFILGDVKLEWPWQYESVHTFVGKQGFIASFPMKGEQKYRLIMIPKNAAPAKDSSSIEIDEFKSILTELSDGKIRVTDAYWLTRFRVHHRMVSHFQKGRCFLAGDAAHIHSPAGGQGMNTGIQDALNLAFKIHSALQSGDLQQLANYEKERMPVARGVLRGTDFVFRTALLPETSFVSRARRLFLPMIVKTKFIQQRVVTAISQIKVARQEISRWKK